MATATMKMSHRQQLADGADDVEEARGLRAAQGERVHDPCDDGPADDGRDVVAAREIRHEVVEGGHHQHGVRHEREAVADPVPVGHEEADELAEALLGVRVQAVGELRARGRQDAERVGDEPDAHAGDDPRDDDGARGGVGGHVLRQVVDAAADHGADDDAHEPDEADLLGVVGDAAGLEAPAGLAGLGVPAGLGPAPGGRGCRWACLRGRRLRRALCWQP